MVGKTFIVAIGFLSLVFVIGCIIYIVDAILETRRNVNSLKTLAEGEWEHFRRQTRFILKELEYIDLDARRVDKDLTEIANAIQELLKLKLI